MFLRTDVATDGRDVRSSECRIGVLSIYSKKPVFTRIHDRTDEENKEDGQK